MTTKIRRKQIEEIELSGYIKEVIDAQEKPTLKVVILSENIPPNVNNYYIGFPEPFEEIPNVIGTLRNNSANILGYHLSGISTDGFSIILSTDDQNGSYNFTYLATEGEGIINLNI